MNTPALRKQLNTILKPYFYGKLDVEQNKCLDQIMDAITTRDEEAYQLAADNFGYLSQSNGDIRKEAKSLHEHFNKLAIKEKLQ